MMTFYSEYVRHCMRFYVRHPNPKFRSQADKLNWNACSESLDKFSPTEREILLDVYGSRDTIPDSIYRVSEERSLKQNSVWGLVNKLEWAIAKRRTLV